MKNGLAPINKVPPEVLALIPDYWGEWDKDVGVIPLTHVCRAWREIYTSRSSLWTMFLCADADKTRVYLQRSKSSPISLLYSWLSRRNLSSNDPLLQVIPYATGRLKYLSVESMPENVGDITIHLSSPAPLLEYLSIDCVYGPGAPSDFVLPPSLFDGNLSSLHTLFLRCVCTNVPWRNMVNLTSFTLCHNRPGEVSIGQLLDFFESASRLERVDLVQATPTSGVQPGRLVHLTRLKWMSVESGEPCSPLFDHLLIPVGVTLSLQPDSFSPRLESYLPRSLGNFRNLSIITEISLDPIGYANMRFAGPNGELSAMCREFQDDITPPVLEYLARIDTSKTERLEIYRGTPTSRDPPRRTLLSMKSLRTLTLYQCDGLHFFIRALHPGTSSSEAMVCPKLEELILIPPTDGEVFNIEDLVYMAAARALVGVKLGTVKIICGQDKVDPGGILELEKHVLDVECGPGVIDGDSDSGEEG